MSSIVAPRNRLHILRNTEDFLDNFTINVIAIGLKKVGHRNINIGTTLLLNAIIN